MNSRVYLRVEGSGIDIIDFQKIVQPYLAGVTQCQPNVSTVRHHGARNPASVTRIGRTSSGSSVLSRCRKSCSARGEACSRSGKVISNRVSVRPPTGTAARKHCHWPLAFRRHQSNRMMGGGLRTSQRNHAAIEAVPVRRVTDDCPANDPAASAAHAPVRMRCSAARANVSGACLWRVSEPTGISKLNVRGLTR